MSELRSTLVCGVTLPLAVTDAIRSRRCTGLMRTFVALFPLRIAVRTMIAVIAMSAAPATDTWFSCSWMSPCRSTEGTADRGFQRGVRPMIVVDGVDSIDLRLHERAAGRCDVEERRRADTVPLLRVRQLLTGLLRIHFLELDGARRRDEVQIALRDVRGHLQLARPHVQPRVVAIYLC